MEVIYSFDYAILNFLQEHACAFTDTFFRIFTHLGDGGIFWMALTGVLLCFRKTRKAGCCMGIALLYGFIVCNLILKPSVARIRPYFNLQYNPMRTIDTLLVKAPPDASFPSGHAVSGIEASLSLLYNRRKPGIAAVSAAALVAFSRVYLYLHYPTDVIAGIAIGAAMSVAAYFTVKLAEKKIPVLK